MLQFRPSRLLQAGRQATLEPKDTQFAGLGTCPLPIPSTSPMPPVPSRGHPQYGPWACRCPECLPTHRSTCSHPQACSQGLPAQSSQHSCGGGGKQAAHLKELVQGRDWPQQEQEQEGGGGNKGCNKGTCRGEKKGELAKGHGGVCVCGTSRQQGERKDHQSGESKEADTHHRSLSLSHRFLTASFQGLQLHWRATGPPPRPPVAVRKPSDPGGTSSKVQERFLGPLHKELSPPTGTSVELLLDAQPTSSDAGAGLPDAPCSFPAAFKESSWEWW